MTALVLLALATVLVPVTVVAARILGRGAGWIAAGGLAALTVAAYREFAPLVTSGGTIVESVPWMPTIGVEFALRVDGLALVFLLLVLGVGALVMFYSARYLTPSRAHGGYFLWMLLFAVAMTGLVLADDLVVLFVFWELTTLCSFFLIDRSGDRASGPAVRTLLVTALGGLALLFAVILIIATTGETRVSEAIASDAWATSPVFAGACAALIAVAALSKSAQFPFHSWLPDAMVAPSPVSAYLHAAAMVKAGVFLLLRFSPPLLENPVWQGILVSCGLVTAVIGAVFALQRFDLKEILAYSTISQLGFLVAAIGVGTPAALAAAVLHTVAHALFKSALFMVVGVIDHRAGTRDIRALHGLVRSMPVSFAVTLLAAASMAGVAPLLGFVSKEGLFAAFLGIPGPPWLGATVLVIAILCAALTFAYSARIVLGGFGGYRGTGDGAAPPSGAAAGVPPAEPREASGLFLAPALLPAVAGLSLGLVAARLDPVISRAAADAAGAPHDAGVALWHGLSIELAASVAVVLLGTALVLGRSTVDRSLRRRLVPVDAIGVVDGLRNGLISAGRRVGDLTRSDGQPRHLAAPLALLVALTVAALANPPVLAAQSEGLDRWTDWLLLAMLLVFLVGAVTARSRLTALLLVGGAGYVVALWFFSLGALDVGLTQLLVEILSVVALVLILRKLPRTFRRVSRTRTAVTAAIALAAGGVAFLGAFALTGRRDISPAGQYFLDETSEATGGTNIVNTILVDFRALDTLGELTVLGIAGLVIVAVLGRRRVLLDAPVRLHRWGTAALGDSVSNTIPARTLARWLSPVIVILSLYLLLRGHYEPGGGFIAALVGGTGFALAYLGAPSDERARIGWPYRALIAAGILTGAVTGLVGYVSGSFLTPIHLDIPLPGGGSSAFTSALVFDIGVYLAVIGFVLVLLNRLGRPIAGSGASSHPGPLGSTDAADSQLRSEGSRT